MYEYVYLPKKAAQKHKHKRTNKLRQYKTYIQDKQTTELQKIATPKDQLFKKSKKLKFTKKHY